MLTARLGVTDLERELRFYESLGFEVERRKEGARVSLEGATFTVEPFDDLRVKDGPLLEWEQRPGQLGAGVQLYILIEDVDGFASRVPPRVSQPWPVQDKPWGLRELTLRTPSGYLLTFAQRRR